jgi:hypothetical protein
VTVGSTGLRLCPPADPTARVAAAAGRPAGHGTGHGAAAASSTAALDVIDVLDGEPRGSV